MFGIFFKTYSEKLWGISCHELDADFAAQRIKRFSLGAAMRNALGVGGREHRTLADQFAYGSGGTGMVYERMARTVRERGGRIFLKTPVRRVVTEQGRVAGIEFGDRNFRPYERVISSMPLTALVARLPEAPEEVIACSRQLRFRNTILVYLEVQGNSICRDNWIYVHSPELQTGRITNFRNWSPQLYVDSPNSILALEYWCNEEDTLWTEPDERLIALATRELLMTGLAGNEGLIENGTVYRIPKCYPVYRRGYRELLEPVRSYLDGIGGLQVIGRYGAFKYNNQDHSILMGLLAAENVLHDKANDLWGVNADYESYQEGCRITETGLVKSE